MKTNTQHKCLMKWASNAGIALTEMVITLPVVFILLAGITKLSLDMQTSIKRDTAVLDTRLRISQIPLNLRIASGWPQLTQEAARQTLTAHSFPHLFSDVLSETHCRGQFKSLKIPVRVNVPHSENKHIRGRLMELRWLSISAQRSACLLEGSSRLGPQAASPLLLAAAQLPSEPLREQAHLALCPIVARGGLKLRQGVVLGVKAAELRDMASFRMTDNSMHPSCP